MAFRASPAFGRQRQGDDLRFSGFGRPAAGVAAAIISGDRAAEALET
jgi:hypothetical protein